VLPFSALHSPLQVRTGPMFLSAAFEHQDKTFSVAFSILEKAIANKAFPAASAAVTQGGKLVALKAFGQFTYEQDSKGAPPLSRSVRQGGDFDVTPSTLFDLASLTKPIATTTATMLLYERGLLDLDAPVSTIIPEFVATEPKDPRRHDVTIRMLLSHSSGLPAYEKLFLKARTRKDLLRAVFTTPLTADPTSRAEYSDIGFIILGAALECLAEESLDRFCQREIFGPLAMINATFNPAPELRPQIPPTQDDRVFRKKIIQGEVQDENAYVLGGVAGHAGLFSSAEDVARFAHTMLLGGAPILRPETVSLFTLRESAPAGTSRTLGWDTPSQPSQSGKYFTPNSFGHLGYTGTSLWIEPSCQLSIALLTNRTWPDCSNQAIKTVRPKFHDAVIEALEKLK
jgi:serine-type D-Ala-D-Ala carboxypeptidase